MAASPFTTLSQNNHQPKTNDAMIQTTSLHTTTSLYFREGSSDKEYHATIEPKGDGYVVNFAYGRRGSTLAAGTKTAVPVPLEQAQAIHQKLVASKVAKGYRVTGDSSMPYQQSGDEGRDTGIRCQLLNAVEESELSRLLTDNRHCLQEKHDGRRLLVRKQGDEITGINRRGLIVALPDPIRKAVAALPVDALIDGEAVGETLHAFDLLELDGHDLRRNSYRNRCAALFLLIPANQPALRRVLTVVDPADKSQHYENLRQDGREGVVLKDMDAPFSPGRPNSGGPQLKFKFVESASFLVTGHNAKRSVMLGLYDGDRLVPAGNVTIPPNYVIPEITGVVEIRYLYAHKQSGCIYQPVYLGPRSDIPADECGVDQLKYKSDGETTTAV